METSDTTAQAQKRKFMFNLSLFEEQVGHLVERAIFHFTKITRNYALFQAGFCTLALIEVVSFLLFFSFFKKSSLIAYSLAAIFLTVFSYFVLRFYFQAKKPEQFHLLKDEFIEACANLFPFGDQVEEFHGSITHALYRFIEKLEGKSSSYYIFHNQFQSISPILEKFSLWCHWEDEHQMQEILHLACIQEKIDLIKKKPIDLEAHAGLVTSYRFFYKIYLDPRKLDKKLSYGFIIRKFYTKEMVLNFQKNAQKAIEELKILNHYSPQATWVYLQLAEVYHDLEDYLQEIRQYEILHQILKEDREVLFRLGTLYFSQGQVAEGLKVYEKLKQMKDPKADHLIEFYGR